MNNDHNIEKEVEQTMQSLEGMERARTDDFFYARLESRLRSRKEETARWRGSHWVAYAVAAAFLLILFNIITLLQYDRAYGDNESVRQENLQAFVDEYQLEIPTIYELNSEE